MKVFTEKRFKLQFIGISAVLFLFIVLGQLFIKFIAEDYKQNIIYHDYGVAGYLVSREIDKTTLSQAFTNKKTEEDMETGYELLQASGYVNYVDNSLIPEVEHFYRKYASISLVFSIALAASILLIILHVEIVRNKKIEGANADIQGFMGGNVDIRLDDGEEGSLSRLFTSVNTMATAQAAHIVNEKQNKEFLRNIISDISHQLKTPLAALKMYNEIVNDEKVENDTVDSFIVKSEREIIRMEILIKNLLKLARLDAGSIELEKKTINLKEFIEETIKGFCTRAEIEEKAILLQGDENIFLSFDEDWLLEAIGNIIKNALDHTRNGDKIEILCDETPLLTTITIRDNGVGIHSEDIHHIFKRFYRSRFSKDNQGIGIGLALAKAIIEKHGGAVTVESELNKGACFCIIFPKLSKM